jgi:hypothetical protein
MGQETAPETKSRNPLFPEAGIAGSGHRSEDTDVTVLARDLRRSKRKAVLMRATLIGTDGVQTVRLKDITSDGAGICCEAPLSAGSDVIIRRDDLFIAARVVWAEGNSAGLEFYRPLTSEWLEAVA